MTVHKNICCALHPLVKNLSTGTKTVKAKVQSTMVYRTPSGDLFSVRVTRGSEAPKTAVLKTRTNSVIVSIQGRHPPRAGASAITSILSHSKATGT